MVKSTKLIEDGVGRKKLKVSLPGGRYQLSLNDGAVALFVDELGLAVGETVPNPFVPIVVATRDAWFPHEKDVDRILDDLPTGGTLTADERAALVEYVTSKWINSRDEERVVDVIASSPIAADVDTDELRVKDLPEVPEGIFGTSKNAPIDERSETDSESGTASTETTELSEEATAKPDSTDRQAIERFQTVPGIGPKRADDLVSAGIRDLDHLAETRPADLAEASGFTYEMAMVAVEGAREVTGGKQTTAERLSEETGTGESTFDAALSSLAASGVPPSEASTVLRVLYGPTIADIDGVTGQQAYFLWREGFETPADVAQASIDELEEVPQLGSKTAPQIKREATELLEEY